MCGVARTFDPFLAHAPPLRRIHGPGDIISQSSGGRHGTASGNYLCSRAMDTFALHTSARRRQMRERARESWLCICVCVCATVCLPANPLRLRPYANIFAFSRYTRSPRLLIDHLPFQPLIN